MGKNIAENFFTKEQEQLIVNAIKSAELNCSGEIRVHLEGKANEDNLKRAKEVFDELGMSKTEARNGVLFYLAIEDKKFSILGDKGIDEKCPSGFWDDIKNKVQNQFRKGAFVEGLVEGIHEAGEALKKHFPYHKDDENELSDQISKS